MRLVRLQILVPTHLYGLVQLSNELTKRDWRWFCERWYEKRILNGQAEIFFIDTNPFILDYHYQEWSNNTGDDSSCSAMSISNSLMNLQDRMRL